MLEVCALSVLVQERSGMRQMHDAASLSDQNNHPYPHIGQGIHRKTAHRSAPSFIPNGHPRQAKLNPVVIAPGKKFKGHAANGPDVDFGIDDGDESQAVTKLFTVILFGHCPMTRRFFLMTKIIIE